MSLSDGNFTLAGYVYADVEHTDSQGNTTRVNAKAAFGLGTDATALQKFGEAFLNSVNATGSAPAASALPGMLNALRAPNGPDQSQPGSSQGAQSPRQLNSSGDGLDITGLLALLFEASGRTPQNAQSRPASVSSQPAASAKPQASSQQTPLVAPPLQQQTAPTAPIAQQPAPVQAPAASQVTSARVTLYDEQGQSRGEHMLNAHEILQGYNQRKTLIGADKDKNLHVFPDNRKCRQVAQQRGIHFL